VDDITRLVLTVDELSGENAESVKEWIRLIATAVGAGILITENAETVYTEWRHRTQIEHTYRFDQKAGLDVEDVRVQTLERMRRIFASVLRLC
jgi:hypothetical protein